MRILAISGPKGSGKDTAADYLIVQGGPLNFQKVNFAEPVKTICGTAFGLTHQEMYDPFFKEKVLERWPYKAPRELMQAVAKAFRTLFAPIVWVEAWKRQVVQPAVNCVLVTDLRHEEEVDALRALGAIIVYIDNPVIEKTREDGIAAGDPLWTDSSEAYAPYLRSIADRVIPNASDLPAFHDAIEEAFVDIFGDYHLWQTLEIPLYQPGQGRPA